jgi:hypothetical protein
MILNGLSHMGVYSPWTLQILKSSYTNSINIIMEYIVGKDSVNKSARFSQDMFAKKYIYIFISPLWEILFYEQFAMQYCSIYNPFALE